MRLGISRDIEIHYDWLVLSVKQVWLLRIKKKHLVYTRKHQYVMILTFTAEIFSK